MGSRFLSLCLLFANIFQVSANPFPWDQYQNAECRAVDDVQAVIQVLQAPATSICSSFLDIPASTSVSAVQPSTVYFTDVVVFTVTLFTTSVTSEPPQKRGLRPIATPIPIQVFASHLLSTACSSLSLNPSPTTSVTTLATPVRLPLVHSLVVPIRGCRTLVTVRKLGNVYKSQGKLEKTQSTTVSDMQHSRPKIR
jgi:hypothetical protein